MTPMPITAVEILFGVLDGWAGRYDGKVSHDVFHISLYRYVLNIVLFFLTLQNKDLEEKKLHLGNPI